MVPSFMKEMQIVVGRRLLVIASYLLARLRVSGFGGGISRHTEGISMSRPPGPVTSHLLR